MPIPLERVAVITNNSVGVLQEINKEFETCNDLKRQMELVRDAKLVRKIIVMMLRPYADLLRYSIPEEILRELGLIE